MSNVLKTNNHMTTDLLHTLHSHSYTLKLSSVTAAVVYYAPYACSYIWAWIEDCKLVNVSFVNIVWILLCQKENRISMTKMYSISNLCYVLFVLFLSTVYDFHDAAMTQFSPQVSLKFHLILYDMEFFNCAELKHKIHNNVMCLINIL